MTRADNVRRAYPLFQAGSGGEIPTSALQLRFQRFDIGRALELNFEWHSRLPKLGNWQGCFAFSAEHDGVVYAVAIWGRPVARAFNNTGTIELRRMAIADNAPDNTASRMIGWMTRGLKKEGIYTKAISYQDTSVHAGTIYKASGWTPIEVGMDTWNRPNRVRLDEQLAGKKIRWEKNLNA